MADRPPPPPPSPTYFGQFPTLQPTWAQLARAATLAQSSAAAGHPRAGASGHAAGGAWPPPGLAAPSPSLAAPPGAGAPYLAAPPGAGAPSLTALRGSAGPPGAGAGAAPGAATSLMAAALEGGGEHQHQADPPLRPDPLLHPRPVAGASEDPAVEDTIVALTSDATGVRVGAPPFPFGMPPWNPTPNNVVVGARADINTFPAPPPPPRTSTRPASALATALVAARAEYAAGQARLQEAALAWEREREASDALAKQIADAEHLLASPASHDGGTTSSGLAGVGTAAGHRTSTTAVLWHDPADPLVTQLH